MENLSNYGQYEIDNVVAVSKTEDFYIITTINEEVYRIPTSIIEELQDYNISEDESINFITTIKERGSISYGIIKEALINLIRDLGVTIDQIYLALEQISDEDLFMKVDQNAMDINEEKAKQIGSLLKKQIYGRDEYYIRNFDEKEEIDYYTDNNDGFDKKSYIQKTKIYKKN